VKVISRVFFSALILSVEQQKVPLICKKNCPNSLMVLSLGQVAFNELVAIALMSHATSK